MDAQAGEADESSREGSNTRRRSKRLTSDGPFNLVVPELMALRDQISFKDNCIKSLKDSVIELQGQKVGLTENLSQQAHDINALEDKIQIAEQASLNALRHVCQQRDTAEKSVLGFQQQHQLSQLKLKREIAKYHRLHKTWESDRQQWTKEKQKLEEQKKRAGIQLLALVEELLNMPPDLSSHDPEVPHQQVPPTSPPIAPPAAQRRSEDGAHRARSAQISRRDSSSAPSRKQERSKSRKRQSLKSVETTTSTPKVSHRSADDEKTRKSQDSYGRGRKTKKNTSICASQPKQDQTTNKQQRSHSRSSKRSTASRPKSRPGKISEKKATLGKSHRSDHSINLHMDVLSTAVPRWGLVTTPVQQSTFSFFQKEVKAKLQSDNHICSPELNQHLTDLPSEAIQNHSKPPKTPASSRSINRLKPSNSSQAILIPPRSSSVGFHHHKHDSSLATKQTFQEALPQPFPPLLTRFLEDMHGQNHHTTTQNGSTEHTYQMPFRTRLVRKISNIFSVRQRQKPTTQV